jgi:hypothetical protein
MIPDKVEACGKAMRAKLEGCDWVTVSEPLAADECQGAFRGVVKKGERCFSSLECAGNLHCEGNTCRDPAPNGTACGGDVDRLAAVTGQRDTEKAHLQCAEFCNRINHQCEPLPEPGARCVTDGNCAPGQICSDNKCTVGKPPEKGASCKSGGCAAGLVCKKGECRERAKAGEPCDTDFDCSVGACTENHVCGMTCSNAAKFQQLQSANADAGAAAPKKK